MSIPKLIHVVWIGSNPFPYQEYLDSWPKHNPDWEVKFWTDENRPELVNEDLYQKVAHHSGKVNILRLELLYRFGGVYADADCQCLRPLDDLPVTGSSSWAMSSRMGMVQNAVMACSPGDKTFGKLVYGMQDHWKSLRGRRRVVFTEVFGTHYITDPLMADPGFQLLDKGRLRGERRIICDRPAKPDTFIVHDCARSWRKELGGNRYRPPRR